RHVLTPFAGMTRIRFRRSGALAAPLSARCSGLPWDMGCPATVAVRDRDADRSIRVPGPGDLSLAEVGQGRCLIGCRGESPPFLIERVFDNVQCMRTVAELERAVLVEVMALNVSSL